MRAQKRLSLLLLTALFVFTSGCSKTDVVAEQKRFDEYLNKEFIETMESDYTTAHIYLQDPQAFGVNMENIEVNLGTRFDEEESEEARKEQLESAEELKDFDYDALTPQQQDSYDIFTYQSALSTALSDEKFDYYASLFESLSGLHYQLPTLFTDWQIRNEQDIQDMILLLQDVKPYIESALNYTKKQEELGLLMVDITSVQDYCKNIIDSGKNSAILQAMKDTIDASSIDATKKETYKQQIEEAFVASFLPAYQNIYDTFETFKSKQNNTEGLSNFEHGKEYYELLLQQSIGSDKTVAEVKEMMQEKFDEHIANLQNIVLQNPSSIQPLLTNTLPQTSFQSYEDILEHTKTKMLEDFPEVAQLEYHIEDINKEIASSSGVAAYFNIPSLDGKPIQQMRVNPNNEDITSISTFSTVSHEGFPGHMYQYAYMYENVEEPIRKAFANNSAYTEGYAVYAQYESFAYLEDIDQALLDAYRENELASYCMIILADVGIHYEGWDVKEFQSFLSENGLPLGEEDAQAQYDQLQANPCAFQPYYVGYHEIADLREKAEDKLQDQFDEKAFHTALLETGTAPFSVIERHIDAYIEEAQ